MMTGVNVSARGELGTIAPLYSEQFSIPPASASIGGVSYGPLAGQLAPLGGVVVAGIVGAALVISGCPTTDEKGWPTIEITVAQRAGVGLKEAYEELRQQMVCEGVPFLNAAELEQEIADRKGTRS